MGDERVVSVADGGGVVGEARGAQVGELGGGGVVGGGEALGGHFGGWGGG